MKKILLLIIFTLMFCIYTFAQQSKQFQILEKPTPEFSEEQLKSRPHLQGTVVLRVTFLANGQVGQITAVSQLPYGLTESAIEAAQKIKFNPLVKNGTPANITKQVQYSFIYGSWETSKIQTKNKEDDSKTDEKAEAIIKKAIEKLGGENYLKVKSQIGRGRFSVLRDNVIVSFQSFLDVIVFPDKERTEFKGGAKNVQTNVGKSGWIYDGDAEVVKEQGKEQIEGFERGINASLDNLLRGSWRGAGGGLLSYVGRRQASLGKRNDVVRLVYPNGFAVEFEFSDDGMPAKSIFKRTNAENEEVTEEDRYAQFVEIQGIKTPFIIDRFTNKAQSSRINYDSVEFNKTIPDSIFAKPKSAKELKKDLKL